MSNTLEQVEIVLEIVIGALCLVVSAVGVVIMAAVLLGPPLRRWRERRAAQHQADVAERDAIKTYSRAR